MPVGADEDSGRRKSLATAYLLLSALGTFGAHKFYLGRPLAGILYACTFGLFSLGTFYDFFTLPEQVRQANAGSAVTGRSRRAFEDAPTGPLSDPDAVVARYLREQRASAPPLPAAPAIPAGFGRRRRAG